MTDNDSSILNSSHSCHKHHYKSKMALNNNNQSEAKLCSKQLPLMGHSIDSISEEMNDIKKLKRDKS